MTIRRARTWAILAVALACGAFAEEATDGVFRLKLLPGECWWGGLVIEGRAQPFSAAADYQMDMRRMHGSTRGCNQAAPLLLSSKGRWIWCEQSFGCRQAGGTLAVTAEKGAPVLSGMAGNSLRDAFRHCSKTFFPPKGHPDLDFFRAPILNTWIEFNYNQSQSNTLAYARSFVSNGVPPGVFMIDCTWQENFGNWNFHSGRFPDPKGMVKEMNAMGYRMMLWMCPKISTDGMTYTHLRRKGYLLKGKGMHGIAESHWWAGKSAMLDCTNPKAYGWLLGELRRLMGDYGVEGFFFDAGDAQNYPDDAEPFEKGATKSEQVRAFHLIGMDVPLQQHRASWKTGGYPLMQTLRDKHATYSEIKACIGDMANAGLLGYSFVVPDLVGGGDIADFDGLGWVVNAYHGGSEGGKVKRLSANEREWMRDFFIRSLQMQTLSPMIQFSMSPWRVLDARRQQIVRDMVALRQKWAPYITQCAVDAGRTGEPMLRLMEYSFPGHGYERVNDQFLMGERLLVAPVVEDGLSSRKVVIPPGKWKADDGSVVEGPTTIEVSTPLERLPHFTRL